MASAEPVSKERIINLIRSLKSLRLAVKKDGEDSQENSLSSCYQYRKELIAGLEEAENCLHMILDHPE